MPPPGRLPHPNDETVSGSPTRAICPHLGLSDDPATAHAFPSPANHCFQADPPAAARLPHQEKYCLSASYSDCPLFRQKEKVAVSRRRRSQPQNRPERGRWPGRRLFLPVLLLLAALLFLGWQNRATVTALFSGAPPATPGQAVAAAQPDANPSPVAIISNPATATATPSPTASATVTLPPTVVTPTTSPTTTGAPPATATELPTGTPTRAATATATATTLPTTCSPPSGWVTYAVQSGETLFRIGLRYGASVTQLQQANCLSTTRVNAGQQLYVPPTTPVSASATPPSTATSSPPPPEATATDNPPPPPPATDTPPPPATDTPAPPPPTATATNPPPPTATPPPPSTDTPPTATLIAITLEATPQK